MLSALEKSAFDDLNLGHESIYDPEIRDRLRELLEGKNVLMMDIDGVLTEPSPVGRIPSVSAIQTLKALDQVGYFSVLWTQATDMHLEVSRFLRDARIEKLCPLLITQENQLLDTTRQKRDYQAAIDTAVWLDAQTRKNFRQLVDKKEMPDAPKMPHVFMSRGGVVDDSADSWYQHLSPRDRASFPLFPVAKSDYKGTELGESDPDEYFGPAWVERIMKEFPLK